MYTWLVNLEEWFWVRVKWVRESAMTVPSPLAPLNMYWVRVDDQVNRSDTGPSSGPQGRGWVLTIWHQASIGFPTARCNTRQGQLYYLHHHIVPHAHHMCYRDCLPHCLGPTTSLLQGPTTLFISLPHLSSRDLPHCHHCYTALPHCL